MKTVFSRRWPKLLAAALGVLPAFCALTAFAQSIDGPSGQSPTEILANLSVTWILGIVAALTVVRLGIVRVSSLTARSIAEILESGIIAIVLVFLIIRPFVLQAYFIPSPSMEPTLLGKNGSGDRILVNKFQYRFRGPQRDDVTVFLAPPEAGEGDVDFIKRLIARPGDHLQVVGGKIIIDGTAYYHNDIRDKLVTAGVFGQDALSENSGDLMADHHIKFVPEGVMADNTLIPKTKIAEIVTNMPNANVMVEPGYNILNGKRLAEAFIAEDPDYDLKIYDGKPLKFDHAQPVGYQYKLSGTTISQAEYDRDNTVPTGAIPAHHYFMMGDNRNDSKDSTEWGPLQDNRVVGKAQCIFWPIPRVGGIH